MATESGLQPGDRTPEFALPDHAGAMVRHSDFAGQQLVLFFYPRADTPGCTTETQDFSARKKQFAAAGTVVIGISADPPRKLARFREKHAIALPLLSDEPTEVLRAFSVWGEKSMYGKTFEGILRTTFLIGRDGRIAEIWRNVKVPNHAQTVLEAAEKRA